MTDRGQSYSSSSDPDVESPQAHKRDSSSSSRTKSSPTSTRDRERDRSTRHSSRRRSSSTDKKSSSSSCSGLLSRTFQLLGRSFSRTVPLLAYIAGLAVVVLLLLGGILLWSYASPDSAEMNDPVLSRMVVSNFHSKKAESVGSASSSLLNLNAAAGDSKGGNTPLTLSGSIVASSPLSYDEDIEDAEDDDVDAIRETDGVLRPTWVFPPWTQQIQQQSALDVQQYATQAAQAALASATDGSMNVSPDDLTIFTFFTPAATASLLALQQHAIYSWTTLIPPRNIHIYTATADDCALVSTLHTDIQCRVSACVETRKIDMSEHDRQEAEEAALAAQKEKEKEREANSGGGSGGGADDWLSGGDSFGGGNGGGETALNYTIPPPRFVTVQAPKVQCFFHEALSSSTISSPFSAFVNDHILLFEDFMSGFNEGTARLGRSFAMVGQTKAVAMNVDDNLDRERWHRDLAQAVQYDTSAEKGVVDKVSTSKIPLGRAHILGGKESNNDDDEEEQSKRKKVSAHDSAHQHEHSDSSGSGHGDECHILNYFVFPTTRLAVERVPAGVLMGGFDTHEHRWESWVLAALLFEHELQVVDATTSVSAVEPTHHQRSNQTDAIHQHNLPLLQSDAWNTKALLGKIQNADFKFDGRCPRCVLVENHQADLSVMLQRQVLPLPDYILMDGVNAGFVGVSAAGSSSKDKNAKNAKGKKLKANAKDSKNTEVAPSAIRSDQNVIVLTVNADYLPLAYNWICRAHELGIHRYVFLAEDRVSYRTLLRMKVSVVIKKYAPFRKSAATFDTMEFQEMLYFRSLFFHQVLNAGYSVVYSHLDSVWFDNPLQYMRNQTCDVYHQAEKIRRVSGGLIAIRPTKIGLMFAKQYVMCEAKSWSFYVEHHRSRWSLSDDRAAECLDYVSQRLVKSQRGKYQKCLLDPLLFPDYHSFIEKEQSIRQGIWPSVVHFSTPHGVWNKTHEIKRWNLWRTSHGKEQESDEDDTLLDEEERKQRALAKVTSAETLEANRAKQLLAQGKQAENIFRDSSTLRSSLGSASISLSTPVAVPCLPVPAALPPPRRSSSHFTLSVTLLACDEANDVAILLSQIENAIYPLHDVIRLTILIDAPPADDEERMQAHHDTVEIAKKFSLSHGTKKVVVRRAHVGAETQWITSWMFQTGDDHELHLVLEPFVRLSPLYYQYIQQTAAAYYFANSGASSASSSSSSSSNEHSQATTGFDPRLMGFTLSHTNLIVGETLTERYGTRLPRSLLEEWSSSEFVAPSYAKNPSFTAIPKQTPRHLYLYQLPPTVAPVFFPRHWLAFTEWYMARRDARGAANSGRASSGNAGGNAAAAAAAAAAAGDEIAFTPCVPTFISNRWWQEDSDKFWWSWLIRFTFEQGFYFLHTNYGVQPNGAISATGAAGNSKPLALAIDARGGVARRSIVLHTSDDPSSLVSLTLFPVLKDLLLFDFHFAYIPYGKAHVLSRRITMLAPDAPLTAAQESLRGSSSLNAPGLVNEDEFEDDELFNPVAHTLAMMRSSLPSSSIGDNGDLSSFHSHYRSRRSRDLSVRARFASMNYDTMQPGAESRCYVIGDERLFTGPLQPLLSHDEDLAQVPIRVLYERTYLYNLQKMERSDPNDIPRFIVFSPKSDFTFDHGLRGLYFSFILSICLKRILLVDWPDFEKAYRPPLQNMQWSLHYPKFYTMYGKGTKSMTKAENTEQFRVGNLFSLYTGQFLINNERVSADRSVFQNQMYFSHLPPLYFGSTSRMRRTGMVLSFLLSNPSPFLLKKVETIRHHTGISRARHLVAVHVPVPTPWLGRLPRPGEAPKFGDPAAWGVLPGVVEKHWQCVKAMLTARNFDPNTTAILFTTNRAVAGVLAKAEEELSEFGRVVHWEERPPPRTYSGDPMAHAERQKQIDNYIDPNIVNGWLLGQAELSVSAGTTYGIFHAARTNFRKPANIVKVGLGVKILDGSYYPISDGNDYCGPMQRIDKPLDVDLEF